MAHGAFRMEIVNSRANMEAEISLSAKKWIRSVSRGESMDTGEKVASFPANGKLEGMLKPCSNPFCEVKLDLSARPRRNRRYCSDRCKMIFWALVTTARLLCPLGEKEAMAVLNELANHGS